MAVIVSFERAHREGATSASIESIAAWHEEQGRRDRQRRNHHNDCARGLHALSAQLRAA